MLQKSEDVENIFRETNGALDMKMAPSLPMSAATR